MRFMTLNRLGLYLAVAGSATASAQEVFAPFLPLVPPTHLRSQFSGVEQQIEASWAVSKFVTLKAAYVYFSASDAIHDAGGNDEQFIMGSMTVRF